MDEINTTHWAVFPTGLDHSGFNSDIISNNLDLNGSYGNEDATTQSSQIPMSVWGYLLLPVVFLAIVGNALVICAILMSTKLKSSSNALIITLSVTNGPLSCLVFSLYIYTQVTCRWDFSDLLCALVGLMAWVVFSADCLNLAFITIQRYCAIVWPMWYRTHMSMNSKLINAIFTSCTYMLPLIIHLPVMFGVGGEMGFDPLQCRCSMLRANSSLFRSLSKILAWGIPTLTMAYCYIHIAVSAFQSKKKLLEINQAQHQQALSLKKNISMAKMMGMCFLAYNLLLVPTMTLEIIDKNNQMRDMRELATVLFWCNTVVNPVIYGFTNKNYREAYKLILSGKCLRSNRVAPAMAVTLNRPASMAVLPSTSRGKDEDEAVPQNATTSTESVSSISPTNSVEKTNKEKSTNNEN